LRASWIKPVSTIPISGDPVFETFIACHDNPQDQPFVDVPGFQLSVRTILE
jgi:hypothetical protein